MRDDTDIRALIDGVMTAARLPRRGVSDDIRRELAAHFEDAGGDAIARFGSAADVGAALRRVYRVDTVAWESLRIALSIGVAAVAALAIQLAVDRLTRASVVGAVGPGFWRAAGLSLVVVIALVSAWEIARRPFDWTRAAIALATCALAYGAATAVGADGAVTTAAIVTALGGCSMWVARSLRPIAQFVAFAAALYGVHLLARVAFSPGRAMIAGAALVAIWSSTLAILSRLRAAFDAQP